MSIIKKKKGFNRQPFALIYPPNTSGCKNVLLIDNTVKDAQCFASSANTSTFPIIYSSTSTKTELLALLKTTFTTIERIGIVFASNSGNSKTFLDGKLFFVKYEAYASNYSENVEFILSVVKEFNVKNIDYLACNTLKYKNWENYYSILTKETGVIVGASNDKTGNIKYGGNWIMENTSQNIELTYFSKSIDYYNYLLDNTYVPWANGGGELYGPQTIITHGSYIYVANLYGNNITQLNLADGTIAKLNWATGLDGPSGLVIHGQYMYVSNINIGTITQVNLANGTNASLNWVTELSGPAGMVIDGSYIYVANVYGGNITQLNLADGTDASLNWATGLELPTNLLIDGPYMYVTNFGPDLPTHNLGYITQFNLADGTDASLNWATGLDGPACMVIDGPYMYVSNENNDTITKLNLADGTDASLNWATGLNTPVGMLINGPYMYVSIENDNTISQLNLATGSTLKQYWAPIKAFNFDDTYPQGMAIDSTNTYMYVTNQQDNTITQIQLSDPNIYNFYWATTTQGLLFPQAIVIDPTNTYMYVANENNNTISRIQLSDPTIYVASWATIGLSHPQAIVIDPTNTYMYVANGGNNTISRIQLSDPNIYNASWAIIGFNFYDTFPQGMAIDSTNTYMYVTNQDDNTISQIQLSDPTIYDASWATTTQGLLFPQAIVIDPTNTYMYVANENNNTISRIQLSDPTIYDAAWATTTQGLSNPQAIVIDPTNTYMYVANGSNNTISRIILYPTSNICFPAGTFIQTDQGIIAIEKINPDMHTIGNKQIVDITKTITPDNYLVGFKKNALGLNYPVDHTRMTKNHKVYYKGKMRPAKAFLGKFDKVVKVNYNGEILYNVLMEDHSQMRVNNLICETLHPDNIIAKLYTKKCKHSDKVRDKIVVLLKECLEKKDYKTYNKIVQRC